MSTTEEPAGTRPAAAPAEGTPITIDEPAIRRRGSDILAGLVFILIAAGFALEAQNYELGTAFRMGPGYIPTGLSAILGTLGLGLIFAGLIGAEPPVPWFPIFNVSVAIIVFGRLAGQAGLVPTVFATALLAALASARNSPLAAVAVAAILTLVSWLVFKVGLGVTMPTFGPMFR